MKKSAYKDRDLAYKAGILTVNKNIGSKKITYNTVECFYISIITLMSTNRNIKRKASISIIQL